MSDQSLAEQLAALQEQLAALTAANGKAAAPAKATGTAAKATAIKRNLDPVEVGATDEIAFRVIASNASGMLTKGARVLPIVNDRVYRSLDVAMIDALQGDGVLDRLRSAIETVEKRAKIGPHAPAKV